MATYVRLRGLSRRPFRVSNSSSSSDVKVQYSSIQTVDIDDQQTLRHLRNSGEGRYITASDNYFTLRSAGTLGTATTGSGLVVRAPRDLVVKSVTVDLGSSTGTAAFNVKLCTAAQGPAAAGTTVGTITTGNGVLSGTATLTSTTWSKGDYLRLENAAFSGTLTNATYTINADQI